MKTLTKQSSSRIYSGLNVLLTVLILVLLTGCGGGDSETSEESFGNGTSASRVFSGTGLYYFVFSQYSPPLYLNAKTNNEDRITTHIFSWNSATEEWVENEPLSSTPGNGVYELINGEWVFQSKDSYEIPFEKDSNGNLLMLENIPPLVYFIDSEEDISGFNLNSYFDLEDQFNNEALFPEGSTRYETNFSYLESAYLLDKSLTCESTFSGGTDTFDEVCEYELDKITFFDAQLGETRSAISRADLILASTERPFYLHGNYAQLQQDGSIKFYEDLRTEEALPLTGSLVTEVIDGVTMHRVVMPAEYDVGFENTETFYTLFDGEMVEGSLAIEGVAASAIPGNHFFYLNEPAAQAVLDNFTP